MLLPFRALTLSNFQIALARSTRGRVRRRRQPTAPRPSPRHSRLLRPAHTYAFSFTRNKSCEVLKYLRRIAGLHLPIGNLKGRSRCGSARSLPIGAADFLFRCSRWPSARTSQVRTWHRRESNTLRRTHTQPTLTLTHTLLTASYTYVALISFNAHIGARKQEKVDVQKLHAAKNTASEVMIDDGSGTIFVRSFFFFFLLCVLCGSGVRGV